MVFSVLTHVSDTIYMSELSNYRLFKKEETNFEEY